MMSEPSDAIDSTYPLSGFRFTVSVGDETMQERNADKTQTRIGQAAVQPTEFNQQDSSEA